MDAVDLHKSGLRYRSLKWFLNLEDSFTTAMFQSGFRVSVTRTAIYSRQDMARLPDPNGGDCNEKNS
jgi:hypothetical protein